MVPEGAVAVTVWKNESDSFAFDDLLTVAKLLDQAHTWILAQQQQQQADRQAA